MSPSSWHLLPPDLIEHQLSQIDLLTAMYPSEDEVTLNPGSESLLERLRFSIESGSALDVSGSAVEVGLVLRLSIPEGEKELHLDITVPFSRPSDEPQEEAPRIRIRARQPAWMTRTASSSLNASIPEDDLFSAVDFIRDSASQHLQSSPTSQSEPTQADADEEGPLVRVWFYFPSISTRSKRDDFITHAPGYNLTGFLYAGKPGLLCLEGVSEKIDAYMRFIKTESWGDIPAHHKKVSERHRETEGVSRVFGEMSEVTDSVGGERRGQRANRGDMKAVEAWLVERGLGDAFAKVLM
ncbi:hypothetical protein CPLU01_14741 [Colletotrichum plurivorum]|uniref:Small nuclear ribonucleoprotein Prp3 C-terminal domain-containing protein n=1 Tax=Colletotrichum plurivorum TaxID=2175906 RepID=A0A8H6JIE2_9PEZI|nr:hypothetical protein CPLU01_14741 [Colletotrichum plurivorum]